MYKIPLCQAPTDPIREVASDKQATTHPWLALKKTLIHKKFQSVRCAALGSTDGNESSEPASPSVLACWYEVVESDGVDDMVWINVNKS